MPSVLIEVRKRYTQEQETGLIEAVHGALVEAFKIKSGDRNVRLAVHEPHRFACPPACEQPDLYTLMADYERRLIPHDTLLVNVLFCYHDTSGTTA